MDQDERTARIRELNDALRRTGQGGNVFITSGVAALGSEFVAKTLADIGAFDLFCWSNDPYGEHDCAQLMVSGHKVIWKIDYYDLTLTWASPDPADPEVTARVMTVMLAEEY